MNNYNDLSKQYISANQKFQNEIKKAKAFSDNYSRLKLLSKAEIEKNMNQFKKDSIEAYDNYVDVKNQMVNLIKDSILNISNSSKFNTKEGFESYEILSIALEETLNEAETIENLHNENILFIDLYINSINYTNDLE